MVAHPHKHDRHAHRGMPNMPEWLSVEEALAKVLAYFDVLDTEQRPLLDALDQTLAADVRAPFDVPPRANSSMDGYAIQAASARGASPQKPVTLPVVGQLAAGEAPSVAVPTGAAIRIMTGAVIPDGADAVVPFEETDELMRAQRGEARGREIGVMAAVPPGANIRPAGEDIRHGDLVLERGDLLRPAEIGVLASLGLSAANVVRRPVVAVIATGDELVEPGESLSTSKIYNSNGYSIGASVLACGGIPKVLGIARDNLASLEAKIEEGLDADLLITTAGVSRGDYDIVKDVLMKKGRIAFWTVRMKPAKPLAFGAIDGHGGRRVPHLGLPGNPVSSMVAFEMFARPAILKMLGRRNLARPVVQAILDNDIVNTDERRVYARAIVTKRGDVYRARLTGNQGSGVLTSMVKANGLAICPEDVPVLRVGQTANVVMLDWTEDQQ